MKRGAILFLIALLFANFSYASSQKDRASSVSQSQTAPPRLQAKDAGDNDPIPSRLINDMYDNCKFKIPDRFTPKAREYYCACNAAAVQGNFLMKDFKTLQTEAGRKPGNKTFEKYITTAVAPCLDMPVEQIEYLECLLDTTVDIRVRYIPPYCQCVARKARQHAEQFADAEIITRLIQYPSGFKDPVNALWDNPRYIGAKSQARNDCIASRYN